MKTKLPSCVWPNLSELVVAGDSVLAGPLQVPRDEVAGPLEVLEESDGEVGHDAGVHGLGVLELEAVEDGVAVGLVERGVEEVVLQPLFRAFIANQVL